MSQSKKHRQEFQEGLAIPPETEYLIKDVEEIVNKKVGEFLGTAPFRIKASGYRPELIHGSIPTGIDILALRSIDHAKTTHREFDGVDLLFDFPINKTAANPWNITVKWTDGIQCRLAQVSDYSVFLIEDAGEEGFVHHSEILHSDVMDSYLEDLGLPDSIWGSDIRELTQDLHGCPDLSMLQRAYTIVDPYTTLEIVHDARIMQDIDDQRQITQELVVNIDHISQDETNYRPDEIRLQNHPRYRNMLRFERDDTAGLWTYAGAYRGRLEAGELVDELVQVDPQLGIPSSKVLEKAFNSLNFS